MIDLLSQIRKKERKKKRPHFLYLLEIKDGKNHFKKVGVTYNITQRLKYFPSDWDIEVLELLEHTSKAYIEALERWFKLTFHPLYRYHKFLDYRHVSGFSELISARFNISLNDLEILPIEEIFPEYYTKNTSIL